MIINNILMYQLVEDFSERILGIFLNRYQTIVLLGISVKIRGPHRYMHIPRQSKPKTTNICNMSHKVFRNSKKTKPIAELDLLIM